MKSLPRWVLGILCLVILLRIPSFFEPYFYGDEMIYLSVGQGVRQGLTLYKDIFDNKPPLLYLTAALSESLFWFKAILCFWNLVTIVVFYKLSVCLFPKKEKVQKLATFLFGIFTTIPLFEGNIVNAELFLIGFSIIAIYILLSDRLTSAKIFIAGTLFGLGTLFKVPAMFDLPIIIVYWLITEGWKNWAKFIKHAILLTLGFLTPILISFGWLYVQGAAVEYIKAAFLQNIGYLSSYRPGDLEKPFYIKNGPLLIRASIVLFGMVILFFSRKRVTKNFILLTLWILFGLFAVTLSERPYPHYFIQVVAPVSFLLSLFFAEKSVEQSLVIAPLFLAFFVPFYYKFYYYQTTSYYSRFINFATKHIDKNSYLGRFSGTTTRNYKIADFLVTSSRSNDKVFMWDSDSAAVYALARRLPPIAYVADYHVNDYSSKTEVASTLTANPPKFIILTSMHPFVEINMLLKLRYVLIAQIDNANIYSRLDITSLYK